MALPEILFTFIGSFLLPIITVVALALFVHCVLSYRQTREQRALRFDSILFSPQIFRPPRRPEEESLV